MGGSALNGYLVDISTDGVPPAERVAYWRERVARRNLFERPESDRPFQARLRRVALPGAELVEHSSEAMISRGATSRRGLSSGDDIAIELVREGAETLLDHNGEHRLHAGDLYVVDYASPLRMIRPRQCVSAIVLPRQRVLEITGADPGGLAALRFPERGMAAMLRQQMQSSLDEAPGLSAPQRAVAVNEAAEMALALLQTTREGTADVARLDGGFYRAALRYIDRHCGDPDLTPERVALALGCSRASLYRVFALRDEGIAELIWLARIERANRMLLSAGGTGLSLSEVAMRCGFREMPTFGRMFRRRYGMTPTDMRKSGQSTTAARTAAALQSTR